MYQRMPQLATVNTVSQVVPRLKIPEAVLDGHCEAYPTDPKSIEGQFQRYEYPAPGHSEVKMYYKYGGSHFGTMTDTNRFARMYRSDKLEFVVNQGIWMEGETKFADVILPACTNFERWDISEFANCGGYIQHAFTQCNHRVAVMQHKCIEPLGESRSDHQIFLDLATRLGLGVHVLRGRHRARLVQAALRRHRPAARRLLEAVPQEGVLRHPAGRRRTAATPCRIAGSRRVAPRTRPS